MKTLMTYYGRNLETKIKVIPQDWATGICVLMLYRSKRYWFFRRWFFIDSVGIEWPEHEGIMKEKVDELFNKYIIQK